MEGPVGCLTVRIVVEQLFRGATDHIGWEDDFVSDLEVDLFLFFGQDMPIILSLVRNGQHVAKSMVIHDKLECVFML